VHALLGFGARLLWHSRRGIAPGLVDTPMLNQLAEETRSGLIAGIPLQRIGTPYEIWLALKFIIECDYFTGRVVEVDGGSTF
jgi:3-oxoacyl-[acyl-carrier protein] reductase